MVALSASRLVCSAMEAITHDHIADLAHRRDQLAGGLSGLLGFHQSGGSDLAGGADARADLIGGFRQMLGAAGDGVHRARRCVSRIGSHLGLRLVALVASAMALAAELIFSAASCTAPIMARASRSKALAASARYSARA